jgi:hypothetical protein
LPNNQITYPIDYTGVSPDNLVDREIHMLSEINDGTRRTLIPYHGPFYPDNFKLEFRDANGNYSELTLDQDYYLSISYLSGEQSTGKKCYAGVTVTTELVNGVVLVTYQSMGTGWWNGQRDDVLEGFATKVYNPRTSSWDIIAHLPEMFPPGPHYVRVEDTRGMEDLLEKFDGLQTVLAQPREHGLFYPQIVVELMTKNDLLQTQVDQMAQEITAIKSHLNLP